MKAYNIFSEASALAGEQSPNETLKKAGVGIINTILDDLGKEPVGSLSDEIEFSKSGEYTLLVNGAAMLICLYLGDDAGLSVMNELYSTARKRLFGEVKSIKNTVFGG